MTRASRLPSPAFRSEELTGFASLVSTGSSMLRLFPPLVQEIGSNLVCLLVADCSRLSAQRACEAITGTRRPDLAAFVENWGRLMAQAGTGRLEAVHLDDNGKTANIVVQEPWELQAQGHLPASQQWGCPILRGEIMGIFSWGFAMPCWAEEQCFNQTAQTTASFRIYASQRTLSAEIASLRRQRKMEQESALASKTDEVTRARLELESRSRELIRQRTRELREEIIHREQTEAIKDELIATVSHELRTPLTSLLGFSELLLDREFGAEKRRHYLEIIRSEALRLSRLIDDFLDLHRIESGASQCELIPTDLSSVLKETASVFSGGTHRVEVNVPAELPLVGADRERIRQLLSNLLSNAIKYSPESDHVMLSADVEGGQVRICVEDRGLGIPEEAIPKLFEKFYRAHANASREIGGTGLGLAISKSIVDAHGGTVSVESTLGQGTTFVVRLPLSVGLLEGLQGIVWVGGSSLGPPSG